MNHFVKFLPFILFCVVCSPAWGVGNEALAQAVFAGGEQTGLVEKIMGDAQDKGELINSNDNSLNATPLYLAVSKGQEGHGIVTYLLEQGADPTKGHKTSGTTPLQVAEKLGDNTLQRQLSRAIEAWEKAHLPQVKSVPLAQLIGKKPVENSEEMQRLEQEIPKDSQKEADAWIDAVYKDEVAKVRVILARHNDDVVVFIRDTCNRGGQDTFWALKEWSKYQPTTGGYSMWGGDPLQGQVKDLIEKVLKEKGSSLKAIEDEKLAPLFERVRAEGKARQNERQTEAAKWFDAIGSGDVAVVQEMLQQHSPDVVRFLENMNTWDSWQRNPKQVLEMTCPLNKRNAISQAIREASPALDTRVSVQPEGLVNFKMESERLQDPVVPVELWKNYCLNNGLKRVLEGQEPCSPDPQSSQLKNGSLNPGKDSSDQNDSDVRQQLMKAAKVAPLVVVVAAILALIYVQQLCEWQRSRAQRAKLEKFQSIFGLEKLYPNNTKRLWEMVRSKR